MISRTRLVAAAAASALALCTYNVRAEEPAQTTSQEIQTLRARLDQLEAQQKESERQRHDAEFKLDEKITNDELTKEATQKSQFITAEGFTAGYTDSRFVIQSDDGNFVFRPWLHLQFRAIADDRQNHQGNKKEGGEDEVDSGFEVRRMRFGFDGNLFSPDLTYFFNWATARNSSNANVTSTTGSTKGTTIGTVSNNLGGVPLLEEAWVKYHIPTTPFAIRAGQIKDPVLHDQIVSSRYQQSAERSITANIFTNGDDFTEAVTAIYDPDTNIRAEAGINHGMRSANTNFLSFPNNGSFNQFNYGFVGRAEYKVMGRWKDYAQVGAVGTKEQLLVIGTGADYSERGHSGQLVGAADVMYADPSGLSLYGAFVDRYTTHSFGYYTQSPTGASINAGDPAVAGTPTNEYSLLAQAGYIINQKIEPFGRWEYIKLQGTPAGSKNYINVLTGGVNYYFQGNRLKVTGEIMYLPQGLPFDDGPSDELANTKGGEFVYEIQLQLLI